MVKTADDDIPNRLTDVLQRLSSQQQREVLDFAVFLERRRHAKTQEPPTDQVRFEGWAGCLADVDKSAVELQHEAMRSWTADNASDAKDCDDVPGGH